MKAGDGVFCIVRGEGKVDRVDERGIHVEFEYEEVDEEGVLQTYTEIYRYRPGGEIDDFSSRTLFKKGDPATPKLKYPKLLYHVWPKGYHMQYLEWAYKQNR